MDETSRDAVVGRLKELSLRGGSHEMLSTICRAVRPSHHGWTERECEELRKDLIRLIGVPEADGGADIRADADRVEEVFVPFVDESEIAPDGPVLGESITEPMRDWVANHLDKTTALTTYPAQFPLVGVTDKDVLIRLDAVDREHVWRMQQLRMSMNERNSRTETELDEALEELRRAKDKLQDADSMLGMCIRLPLASDNEPIRVGDVLEDGEYAFVVDSVTKYADGAWSISDENGVAWAACDVRHRRELTVEELLTKVIEEAVGYGDAHTTAALEAVLKYADRLRLAEER